MTKKSFWGDHRRVFMIAEVSANHQQDYDLALRHIRAAKAAGADAVKFQCYTPDTMTINADTKYFKVRHPVWGGQTLYELYQKAYTPWSWFPGLKKEARRQGIVFFATAFDKTSVDFLEELGVPFHKIASFEFNDLPLIAYAARTRRPMILSAGMASRAEVQDAVRTARRHGVKDLALLKCVSNYPADPADMHLRTIPDMQKRFHCPVGLSDHTMDNSAAVAAVALGGRIIEKHFTISRRVRTPDSFFSVEPQEFKALVKDVRAVEQALGQVSYGETSAEKKSRCFRRSLFAAADIAKGEKFSEHNVRSIRPGAGLAPKYFEQILGRVCPQGIKKGMPLSGRNAGRLAR